MSPRYKEMVPKVIIGQENHEDSIEEAEHISLLF